MDSGLTVCDAQVTIAPGWTGTATAEPDETRVLCAAQLAAAKEIVQRAQAALAAAEERLRRAQDIQKDIQEQQARLELVRSQQLGFLPHRPAREHA